MHGPVLEVELCGESSDALLSMLSVIGLAVSMLLA